jgi:hypothetical protein
MRTLALVVLRTSSIVGRFEDLARPKIDLFGLVGPASVSGNVDAGLVYQSAPSLFDGSIAAIAAQASPEPNAACPGPFSIRSPGRERVRFRRATGSALQKVEPKPTDPATILCRWPQSIGLRSGYRWPPV